MAPGLVLPGFPHHPDALIRGGAASSRPASAAPARRRGLHGRHLAIIAEGLGRWRAGDCNGNEADALEGGETGEVGRGWRKGECTLGCEGKEMSIPPASI
eukprot:768235-Hanusia_phi.AAC.7